MNHNKTLRIIAGSLCILVAILRIFLFFFDINGALVYSFIFIDPTEAVDIILGIVLIVFGFIIATIATIVAFIIYVVLGILQITLRKFKIPSIICTVITSISIILSIRAIILYAGANMFNLFLTILLVIYIVIFSLCIVSFIMVRKEE